MLQRNRRGVVFLLVLSCIVLAGALAFAGGQGETAKAVSGPVTVKVLPGAWSGDTIDFIRSQAEAWAAKTGNKVEFASVPSGSSEVLALAQQYLGAGSTDIDIYPMDVVWPGMLGRYFTDLGPYFGKEDLKIFNPAGIAANTVDGRLVGIPFYGDVGLFYYREDLLKKYGIKAVPATWAEMRSAAEKIQAGERAEGKASFWGYVFDGMAYEGLTCNVLEWVASFGGGTFVDASGAVTIDNPKAVAAYREAASWLGTIIPPGTTSYKTEDARGVWQAGNSAFMRNWPFAYALGEREDSPIRGTFAVGTVPHGPDGQSYSTLGGWQLAVSRYSKQPAAAADLIKFLTSEMSQKERMLKLARIPTAPALFQDPDILAATPWLQTFMNIKAIPRPAAATKSKYNEASNIISTVSRSILLKEIGPEEGVKKMARDLTQLKGSAW